MFVVCAANDVSTLPLELARAERFDALFFLDLPGEPEKELNWNQYVSEFGLDSEQKRPEDAGWKGAEIKSCCRLVALLDVPLVQAAASTFQEFGLTFSTAPEARIEYRTWWHDRATVEQDSVRVRSANRTADELEPVFEEIEDLLLRA